MIARENPIASCVSVYVAPPRYVNMPRVDTKKKGVALLGFNQKITNKQITAGLRKITPQSIEGPLIKYLTPEVPPLYSKSFS